MIMLSSKARKLREVQDPLGQRRQPCHDSHAIGTDLLIFAHHKDLQGMQQYGLCSDGHASTV